MGDECLKHNKGGTEGGLINHVCLRKKNGEDLLLFVSCYGAPIYFYKLSPFFFERWSPALLMLNVRSSRCDVGG